MAEIIGVDVGNGYTKTVSTDFESSVKKWGEEKPSLTDSLVMYKGNYYTVGGGDRVRSKTDNKEDENSLILALAGIGEELKRRNLEGGNIILSEGLPLERRNDTSRKIDEKYYLKGEDVYFEYEDKGYNIHIEDVIVNAQCVSAVIEELVNGTLPEICLIIDVGSWTVDILPIENGKPQGAKTKSLNCGIIDCINSCNEEIRRRTFNDFPEFLIKKVMMGELDTTSPKYSALILDSIKRYIKNLADTLIELKYNIEVLPCIFVGGGSSVIKNYGKDYFPMAKFMTDIHLNAIGYEKIAKNMMRR